MKQSTRMPSYGPFFRNALVTLGVAGLIAAPAWGGGLREVDQTIFGMDCAPCAAGIEKGLNKLEGVTSVRVSLNEGKAVVALSPDSRTSLAKIREVIRHNGFTPKDATVKLVGRIERDGNGLRVSAGAERFALIADDKSIEDLTKKAGTNQEVGLSLRILETSTDNSTAQLISID